MMSHLLIALAVSLSINLVLFLLAYRYKSDKLTDVSYALSFIALAIFGLTTGRMTTINLLIFAMVVVWAGRLGSFLYLRSMKKGSDARFEKYRSNFFAFGKFWLLQAITAWVVSLPVLLAFRHTSNSVGVIMILGVLIWLKGFIIETVADLQKFEFSNVPSNKNKWIDSGLWRYSRHPNYFGEIVIWIGIYLTTVPLLSGSEALFAGLGPIYITVLLLFVSGIPPLEKLADSRWSKDKGYKAYKKRTSRLIPFLNNRR